MHTFAHFKIGNYEAMDFKYASLGDNHRKFLNNASTVGVEKSIRDLILYLSQN